MKGGACPLEGPVSNLPFHLPDQGEGQGVGGHCYCVAKIASIGYVRALGFVPAPASKKRYR